MCLIEWFAHRTNPEPVSMPKISTSINTSSLESMLLNKLVLKKMEKEDVDSES